MILPRTTEAVCAAFLYCWPGFRIQLTVTPMSLSSVVSRGSGSQADTAWIGYKPEKWGQRDFYFYFCFGQLHAFHHVHILGVVFSNVHDLALCGVKLHPLPFRAYPAWLGEPLSLPETQWTGQFWCHLQIFMIICFSVVSMSRLFMTSRNRTGTLDSTFLHPESLPLMLPCCFLSMSHACIQFPILPLIPWLWTFRSNLSVGTLSKSFAKSK